MKNIFTLLFVFFLYNANANNYYFSSASGNDSRTSAQARSASTPWKTLNKLNSFFSSLQPGDSVLLKRGDTFFGSITVRKSGTSSSPIVIGTYGSGTKPVITSLVTMTDWVSKGNGIWESHNLSLAKTLNTVLINNVAQQMGRYPNSDAPNKGYLTLESYTANSITDNQLASSPNWTGAEMVLRTRRWVIDRNLIKNHSGNKITYTKGSGYTAKDGFGYFIQNDIRTLDKSGEWYFNSSAKKLSIYFGSNNPSSYTVQVPTIENLINLSKYKYVVFNNLAIKGANEDGFDISSGTNITISNCDVMFSRTGVTVKFSNYLKIENCTIANSNDNGIDLGYSGDYAVIRNNKITNTSLFAGMGENGDSKGFGIQSSGNSSIIEHNEVINTGSSGISFNGDNTIVKNNYVNSYCLTKDDGSGIYTFTGSGNANRTGRKVIGNIVLNGIGAPEGVNGNKPLVEGIYLDDNASGVEISGNTVANIPGKGIFLHNARNVIITNNTVFNNEVQLSLLHDTKGDAIKNCVITNNNFFSKMANQSIANFKSREDNNNLIGKFDSNFYARPIDDRIVINNMYVNNAGKGIKESLDLAGWKDRYNKDASSKRTAKQIAAYRLNSLTGENKIPNGSFTSNTNGVLKSSCNVSWSDNSMLDGGYLQVSPTAKGSSVYMRIGGLTAGKKYLVKYSVKGSENDNMTISICLKNDASPYNNISSVQTRKLTTARAENEMLFYAASSGSVTAVTFSVNNASKYYIDNIKVYEADADITNVDDSIRFVYNETLVNKTINLDGNYIDAKNNKYSNSIELEPFTSAVLIKNDAASVNNPAPVNTDTVPEVSLITPVTNTVYKEFSTIRMTANASDNDGTISKVEFYNGSILLHTEKFIPYTYSWLNVPAGTYTITAKATDNNGNVTTSAGITVNVAAQNSANRSIQYNTTVAVTKTASVQKDTVSAVKNAFAFTLDNKSLESKTFTMKVFPNPAVNKIQINIDGLQMRNQKATVSIQNMSGMMLTNTPVILSGKTIEADVTSLKTGVYIIRIATDNFTISRKFIKN